MVANQDSQRLSEQRTVFTQTQNSQNDLFYQFKDQITDNKFNKKPYHDGLPAIVKQVSLDSQVYKDLEVGEKTQISKSNIGRGVKIGQRCKIVNSVILNNVSIGNE